MTTNDPQILFYELESAKIDGFYFFIIINSQTNKLERFLVSKKSGNVEKLRSLHYLVKTENWHDGTRFKLCNETETFIFFNAQNTFTSNQENRDSLNRCLQLSSERVKVFAEFLFTTRLKEGKTYKQLQNEGVRVQSKVNDEVKELFNKKGFVPEPVEEEEEETKADVIWRISEENKFPLLFYQTGEFPEIEENQKILIPNKKEFWIIYQSITPKKFWLKLLLILTYVFGVEVNYETLHSLTYKEFLELVKNKETDFGSKFKNQDLDYVQELKKLGERHFRTRPYLFSKDETTVFSKRAVYEQIRRELDPGEETLRESIFFFRYHYILHYLGYFADIKATSRLFNISIPSVYRIQNYYWFEWDEESLGQL